MRLAILAFAIAAVASLGALAEEPDMNRDARIQADIDKAKSDVDAKYGGKSDKDLTAAERRAKAKDQDEAAKAAIEKNGADSNSYYRERGKMNRGQQQEFSDKLSETKKKDEEAAKKKPEQTQGVVVEKGLPKGEEGPAVEAGKSGNQKHNKKRHKSQDE